MQLTEHDHFDTYNDDEKKFYHLNSMSKAQTYGQEAITEYILNNVYNFAKVHGEDTDFSSINSCTLLHWNRKILFLLMNLHLMQKLLEMASLA